MTERTDFGYEQVPVEDKAQRVRGVFDSVAGKYDLMNDLMSAGLHRLWKRFAVNATRVRPGMRVLDLAGGTGDLAVDFARRVGPTGTVVLTDINGAMLEAGRDRLINAGLHPARGTVRRGKAAVRRRAVRLRQHRLRLAQRNPQGQRARRNAPRVAARRRRGGARVFPGLGAAGAGVRLVQFHDAAAARAIRRRAMATATAISPNRFGCTRTRRRSRP